MSELHADRCPASGRSRHCLSERSRDWLYVPLLALAGMTACASSPSAASPAATPSQAPAATLSDGEIGAIYVAANKAELEYAAVALQKAESPEVRQFARTAANEHAGFNRDMTDVLARAGIAAVESDASKDFRDEAVIVFNELRDRTGDVFDRYYIDHEITFHEKLLDRFDRRLIPSAANPALRELLTKTRAAISGHLAQARQIRRQF